MTKYYASHKKMHGFEDYFKTWENINDVLLTEKNRVKIFLQLNP